MKTYTDKEREEFIEAILELCLKKSLTKSCEEVGVPIGTFSGWMGNSPLVAERYASARSIFCDLMAEEIMDIADEDIGRDDQGRTDNAKVNQNRLRVDSRKWYLSKVAYKKFGDRLTLAGDEDAPIAVTAIQRKVVQPDGKGQLTYDEAGKQTNVDLIVEDGS